MLLITITCITQAFQKNRINRVLLHAVLETEKAHSLPSSSWRYRKVSVQMLENTSVVLCEHKIPKRDLSDV
jgi:hypothetical protein